VQVLHAANGIQNALVQCHTLLRPNGRLLLLEMTNREHLLEPFIFGLLPGLSRESSPEAAQNESPLLTEKEWGEMLLGTGFSGLDVVVSDAGFLTEDQISAVMISRAVIPQMTNDSSLCVIYDELSATQTELLQHLEAATTSSGNVRITSLSWNSIQERDLTQSIYIFLADPDGGFLGRMGETDLEKLKQVVSTVKALIWVTFSASDEGQNPREALVNGWVRTLATENEVCRVISVTLDAASEIANATQNIVKVVNALLQANDVPEDEYFEQNGVLCIPRVIQDRDLSAQVFAQDQVVNKRWTDLDNPRLTIRTAGRLNTLHFEQTMPLATPLGSEDVLIEVKAVGLNSRDVSVANGLVYDEGFGNQCAGIVLQTGPSPAHTLQVGDRVFGLTNDAFALVNRCKAFQLQKIPSSLGFCEAATYPAAFCTAYYGLVHCAKVKKGESVLVHRAAGEIGQATIQLAQLFGCYVYATLDQVEHATLIHETYGVPRSQILSSCGLDFGNGIRRLTHGRGVNVVVCPFNGEAARESWDCLAPMGRFIDVSEVASASATTFPALTMGKNRILASVNIQELAQNSVIQDVFGEVVRLIETQKLKPLQPLEVFTQIEVEAAFRLLQNENCTTRVAVDLASDTMVDMVLDSNKVPLFDPEASYLLAGGFGGIGQNIARWMVQNGVKNLIIPSRSPYEGTGSAREALVQELGAQGARIEAPVCDIVDKDQVERTLQDLADMPPIKGCIQAAMALRDSSFAKMTIDDWHTSLAPKLTGSWNLHQLLPSDLDFFIMFSSSTGIMGSFGQANYTAGNTYQDALATHRVQHGQRATSFAFSMVSGVGWVAENAQIRGLLKARGMLEEVSLEDIYELLRFCCDPQHADVGAQIITPLSLPADLRALGIVEPLGSTRPIYSHLHTLPSRYAISGDSGNSTTSHETKKLPSFALQNATTLAEATDIITEAIQMQLSSLLVVSKDDIDPQKPIHKYGVDSLVAVEMRNWFAKGVGADVGTTEILEDMGIGELAGKVASRSKFVKDELKD
jgi:NADPH:quinone reductase-like Zn-dependent oxidoreductase/aryl carrier-like protein